MKHVLCDIQTNRARATWAIPDPNSVYAELVEALPFSSCLARNRLKKRAILRQAQDSRGWGEV
ncbi:MAG: hypothetical protein K2W91_09735, partial [Novosphingobium sp.]|nr:hypothetical protein [Novosphingobium sp.]